MYHLTPEGPKKCDARVRKCKYAHFETEAEAYDAYESNMLAVGATYKTLKVARSQPADEIEGTPAELAQTKAGQEKLAAVIGARLAMTDRFVAALESRDPSNPEASQPVRKTVYAQLKKRLNAYRDRTAQLVEAEDESPHKTHLYEDRDLERIGNARATTGFEPNTREWLEARQDTVGGSDVAALAEMDFTPEDEQTYFMKRNLRATVESKTQPLTEEALSKNNRLSRGGAGPLYRGTVWENRIRDKFAEDHPELTVINTKSQYVNRYRPWQKVNVDGVLSSDGKTPEGILEIKTGGVPEKWDKGVPLSYRVQTLYYLNATGLKYAKVRACINDTDHRDFTLKADDEIVPGSGITMKKYMASRVQPWFKELRSKV